MTTARLGSQFPLGMARTSRKPRTLVGSSMPERNRPQPKMKPQTRLASARMGSASKAVPRHRNHDDRRHHENAGSGDRSRRQPRNAADAVPGRAAVTEPGAEADEEPGDGDGDVARRHLHNRQRMTEQHGGERRGNQRATDGSGDRSEIGHDFASWLT